MRPPQWWCQCSQRDVDPSCHVAPSPASPALAPLPPNLDTGHRQQQQVCINLMMRKIRFDRSNGLKVDQERKIDSLINYKYLLEGIMGWCAKNMFPTMPAPAFSGNALWGDAFMSACGHRKNICCQKIFSNSFSFQDTEIVLTSKWGRIQPEIQI